MSWSHGDLTWLRLFQAVGNLNVDAQSLMLATVAKGLVGLGYEVEVSFHTAPFHVLPQSSNIRHSNILGESKFFKFDQIFRENHKIYGTRLIYFKNKFNGESNGTYLIS